MRPAHSKSIVIAPRKPRGGRCCEKCRHLEFACSYGASAMISEPYCGMGHALEATRCPSYRDVSVDTSRND